MTVFLLIMNQTDFRLAYNEEEEELRLRKMREFPIEKTLGRQQKKTLNQMHFLITFLNFV